MKNPKLWLANTFCAGIIVGAAWPHGIAYLMNKPASSGPPAAIEEQLAPVPEPDEPNPFPVKPRPKQSQPSESSKQWTPHDPFPGEETL